MAERQIKSTVGGICKERPLSNGNSTNQLVSITEKQHGDLQSMRQSKKKFDSSSKDITSNNLVKIPISAYLVVLHLTLERLSILGVMSILPLYLTSSLNFTERQGQMFYHFLSGICYLAPILGGVIADKYIGRFKTVVIFDLILMSTYFFIPISVFLMHHYAYSIFTGIILSNLVALAVASGGVKACLSTFAADQVEHTVQDDEKKAVKDTLFSTIYFCVNFGGLVGQLFLPTLRTFSSRNSTVSIVSTGNNYRPEFLGYPLAFSTAFIIFLASFILFVGLKRFYFHVKPKGDVLSQYLACLLHMARYHFTECAGAKQSMTQHNFKNPHILEPSFPHYTPEFIRGVSRTLGIIIVLLPIPVFWALYEQQGSTWIFQANQMNGELGNGWTVQPEQMLTLNVLSCLLAIPFMNVCLYPLLARVNLLKTLNSRIVLGFLVAAASFVCCAVVQHRMETGLCGRLPPRASQESNLVVYNLIGHPVRLLGTNQVGRSVVYNDIVSNRQFGTVTRIKAGSTRVLLQIDSNILYWRSGERPWIRPPLTRTIVLRPSHETLVVLQPRLSTSEHQSQNIQLQQFHYSCSDINVKSAKLYRIGSLRPNFDLVDVNKRSKYSNVYPHNQSTSLPPGPYWIRNVDQIGDSKEIRLNSTSINIIQSSFRGQPDSPSPERMEWSVLEVYRGRATHMAEQIPQICIMTFAEILICISVITFAYNEAPSCMKTIVQALNQLTVFAGNGLVILVSTINHQQHTGFPWWEMIFYAVMAVICSGIMYILGKRHEANKVGEEDIQTDTVTISKIHFRRIQSEIIYPCWLSEESLHHLPQETSPHVSKRLPRSQTSGQFF